MMKSVFALAFVLTRCTSSAIVASTSQDAGSDASSETSTDSGLNSFVDGGYVSVTQDAGSDKNEAGAACVSDLDCESGVCSYTHLCVPVAEKSCSNHFGGDTCGLLEVGEPAAQHESCCKSLRVPGFSDSRHAGKSVYVGKYEITAGRVRTWLDRLTAERNTPNVRGWVTDNKPDGWVSSWSTFLPTSTNGDKITINRLLLGDPRHDGQTQSQAGPGVVLPPATDQTVDLGTNFQFGSQVYADVHGNNCAVFEGAYGFPTFFYPAVVLTQSKEVPRADALGFSGETVPAQEWLDSKSMNCITGAMLQAFCAWDGGQLASNEALDFITSSPLDRSESVSGCGTQYDSHGNLLGNSLSGTVQSGGVCPAVSSVNATFDAGDALPVAGSSLNTHRYHYPDLGNSTSDKSWEVSAPGRTPEDVIKLSGMTEGWYDLAGNLTEQVYVPSKGLFGLRYRGVGYGSARSDLNVTLMPGETILRVQRPESKSALSGGRCMYFR